MKVKLLTAAITSLVMTTTLSAADTTVLSNDLDKLSYSIGADLGRNFKKQSIVAVDK